ncbi:MAG TPA: C1 family peptidase [Gemmatimonadales bacterium]|jgi:hypothetical protein
MTTRRIRLGSRILDARPDTVDFRDRMYQPTLVEVPTKITLQSYRQARVPILDQGTQGACTGFGLATVANYLLRSRRTVPDDTPVSPRMLYYMARRYDEYPGTADNGSSARGAMKGWLKHGVCSDALWPHAGKTGSYSHARAADAQGRPLGAYLRVNHGDLVAMHSAIAEVGVLYATGNTHAGWDTVKADGLIPYTPDSDDEGGHAFAIVAYDEFGFWIQNSWSADWGFHGFARISYDDWLANATDTWVARLAAPVRLVTAQGKAASRSDLAGSHQVASNADLRPHVIALGDNGELRNSGPFGTTPDDVKEIFTNDFARITAKWSKRRILLYAHGGLVSEDAALQRIADWRASLLASEVYPLAFIWKTDLWSTITNVIEDALGTRKTEGILQSATDFMLDRTDDFLEPVARHLGGKLLWDEMKKNAIAASDADPSPDPAHTRGGALVAQYVSDLARNGVEVHMAAHSAGSILLAPLVGRLADDVTIKTCTLWAPAITMALYGTTYDPAIVSGKVANFAIYTLSDKAEQDDNCGHIYNKSLLYLVSNAFEATARIPIIHPDGEPLLGMTKFVAPSSLLKSRRGKYRFDWVVAPNDAAIGTVGASRAEHHGDFDDDEATVKATLRRIIGTSTATVETRFVRSAAGRRDLRKELAAAP